MPPKARAICSIRTGDMMVSFTALAFLFRSSFAIWRSSLPALCASCVGAGFAPTFGPPSDCTGWNTTVGIWRYRRARSITGVRTCRLFGLSWLEISTVRAVYSCGRKHLPFRKRAAPIASDEGTVLRVPSDDELRPGANEGIFSLNASLDLVGAVVESPREKDNYVSPPNVRTPKRSGGATNAPPPLHGLVRIHRMQNWKDFALNFALAMRFCRIRSRGNLRDKPG